MPSWVENYLHPQLWLTSASSLVVAYLLSADGDRYQSAAFPAVDLLMRLGRVKDDFAATGRRRCPAGCSSRFHRCCLPAGCSFRFHHRRHGIRAPPVFTVAITEFTHRLAATSISTFRPFGSACLSSFSGGSEVVSLRG